ncbi:MAG: DegT/DnrJ/EryC1/StrS family aminotransferase [Armatimonadetes bacterium]|nr:DegT/DnrJ/EryC1/StrS family aminotransferase [Armatimonadota bacterium]
MAIPLANPKAQYLALKDEISTAVQQVLDSGQFILGPNVTALESEVPAVCGAGYGISVNSGTDAIVIALAACGIGPGDEVITTPFTFVATTEAIMIVGAKPVYADIDPSDFNLDPANVEEKITDKTKAILPVHLYGQCADTDKLEAIAVKHNLKMIYDGAQAIGAARNSKGMGAYGHASTLSFYPTKNLGGCGDGGMVLMNDEGLATRAKQMRFHGMDATYSYQYVGYCSRLDEIQAAILRVKLKKIQEWNDARRANAAYYIENLGDLPLELPRSKPENYHIYHQFTVRFPRRDELKAKLQERGVGSAVFYPSPLHLQRAYLNLGYKQGDFPESERAAREVLSLPVLPELSVEDRELVMKSVREAVKEIMN